MLTPNFTNFSLTLSLGLLCLVFQNSSFAASDSPDIERQKRVIDEQQNQLAKELFEQAFEIGLSRSPESQTFLGIKDNDDKWDDMSYGHDKETLKLSNAHWKKIKKSVNYELLDHQNQLSYRLLEYDNKRENEGWKYWYHHYRMNQMRGTHAAIPAFLINYHPSANTSDLDNYITRLGGVEHKIDQLIELVKTQEKKDIMPPAFVFPYLISDCRNLITGAPFDDSGKDSPLLEDFRGKVKKLGLVKKEERRLIKAASKALVESVAPSYTKLIAYLTDAQGRADTKDGAWKLPQGKKYYEYRLQRMTTTDLSAEEIHQIGLNEVTRIHGEMEAIMDQVNFKGDLNGFFEYMRTASEFYLPNSKEGKQQYLDLATQYIGTMQQNLDSMFKTQPKIDLIVKAVEPFREKSAGKAFYSRPSPDGQRPGIFYANLYNTADMPTYELEALAYHEGIPGHHLQLAISVALDGLPRFRKYGRFTAYSEGWGLYSERLAKDFGFYQDPYSDFGRLAMELWRAGRLVVDTGIHYKKWTREEAIKYLQDNTPNPNEQIVKGIERYIVMPGQATAYKIGMNKILELRAFSKAKLGKQFDIREFHEQILTNGAVPLWMLEENIRQWASDINSAIDS